MVLAGQVEIVGRLNIDDIKAGQRQVNVGFEVMRQKTQSTFGSMELLGRSAAGLGESLAKVSGLALTGLTGLAGLTPTLAPQFAKLKVETFKLAQVFGKELQPAFEVATQKFGEFVSFLEGGSPMAEFTKDVGLLTGATGIALIGSQLLGLPKTLTIGLTLATAVATQGERIAGFAESALGKFGFDERREALGVEGIVRSESEFAKGIGAIVSNTVAGAIGGAAVGSVVPGFGTAAGGLVGAIGGAGKSLYDVTRDGFFYNSDTVGLD
ncbi:MAG TPA: hypothetical protein DCL21_01645 [Alphaproteobacteria bacterium]|nr:hypothetical protein [Alphaproteobacteria bacterium]